MKDQISIETIREDFPALQRLRNGKPPIYLDNACTTLMPQTVIAALNEYYTGYPACGGNRSSYWFADEVNDRLEGNAEKGIKGSRQIVQEFINARLPQEIIFTFNTSHAINIVALGYPFLAGDVVLVTDKEHNSNLIPWLKLQKDGQIIVQPLMQSKQDSFDFNDFENKLKSNRVRLVSLAYTSNLTGFTIPAKEIIQMAHRYGSHVLLDAAQTAPHQKIDVQDLDVDFLAFSIHKMCGPKGVGILYGKNKLLGTDQHVENKLKGIIRPFLLGGGTIRDATYTSYDLLNSPERFEVGTQNYAGQIGAGVALKYITQMGLNAIHKHTIQLNTYLTNQLISRYVNNEWFHIIGPQNAALRGPMLTFEVKRPNAVGIAQELSEKCNIMIRDGALCAHSYFNYKYGQGWTLPKLPSEHRMIYRVSLYFYNTKDECHVFLENLNDIFKDRSYI